MKISWWHGAAIFALAAMLVAGSFAPRTTALQGYAQPSSIPTGQRAFPYQGRVYHIFFHSLVVYPQLAYLNDSHGDIYRKYMVTRDEFENILGQLYANNFVLVDIDSLYSVDASGSVSTKPLTVPAGKKPLVISLDDLDYYKDMAGRGFADKLVLDQNGDVATEIADPAGAINVTRDGDIVPIMDDFVKAHPDFSIDGAKGVIAITGRDGILGYRTQSANAANRPQEIAAAQKVVARLEATGWRFASHSYSHSMAYSTKKISLADLAIDIGKWKDEVGSIVGPTDIFIGPFGQIFSEGDPRRDFLVSQGFHVLYGVGADDYSAIFRDHAAIDRTDIDDYRIHTTPWLLKDYFNPTNL